MLGGAIVPVRNQRNIPRKPRFFALDGDNGVSKLDAALTINGVTKTPLVRYVGADADATSWDADGYGTALATQDGSTGLGKGVPTLNNAEKSVEFNNDQWFKAGSAATGDITTGDIVMEVVFSHGTTGTTRIFDKTAGGVSYSLQIHSSDRLSLKVDDGVTATTFIVAGTTDVGSWHHLMIFINRDEASSNGMGMYMNAYKVSNGDFSAFGSLSNAGMFTVGATEAGASILRDGVRIAYLAMWEQADWHQAGVSGPNEWVTIAFERYCQAAGIFAKIARGTAAPIVATRGSSAYLDKIIEGGIRQLYRVGDNFIRMRSFRDNVNAIGLPTSIHNDFPDSEDLSAASWGKVACTIDTTSGENYIDADGTVRDTHGIVGTAVDTTHAISTAMHPPTPYKHLVSGTFKAGAQGAVRLASTNLLGANVWQQFDLNTGTAGLAGGTVLCSGMIKEDPRNPGWYRCCMSYQGGAFAHTTLILPIADADVDDVTFTGDGATTDLHVARLSHDFTDAVTGADHRDNYVKTVGLVRSLGELVVEAQLEETCIQLCPKTEEFDDAAWTVARGAVTADQAVAPDGNTTADLIDEDSASGSHGVYSVSTAAVVSGTKYCASFWIKKINRQHVAFFHGDGFPNDYAVWDLDDPTASATVAGEFDDGGSEDWGNGWIRCWATWTSTRGAGNETFYILSHNGVTHSYAGANQDNYYLWGAFVHAGDRPFSYIKNEGVASVTRLIDTLTYKMDDGNLDNNKRAVIECDIALPDIDTIDSNTIWSLVDASDPNNDRILLVNDTTVDTYRTYFTAGGVGSNIAAASGDHYDGAKRTIRIEWSPSRCAQYVDGVLDPSPAIVPTDIPDDIDQLNLGHYSAGSRPNGIGSLKIFDD